MKSMLVGFIPRGCYELLSMQFKGLYGRGKKVKHFGVAECWRFFGMEPWSQIEGFLYRIQEWVRKSFALVSCWPALQS